MTNIERKALELVHEVVQERSESPWIANREADAMFEAFCRAIEQHEAFRKEVSDAVVDAIAIIDNGEEGVAIQELTRFIIAKPDPLVEAWNETWAEPSDKPARLETFRAALAKRGGRIVFDD